MSSTLSYTPADPGVVVTVSRMRLFATAERTGEPVADLTPGVLQPDLTWLFTLATVPPDGTYYLTTTVTYTDGVTADDISGEIVVPFYDSGIVPVSTYRDITGDTTTPAETLAGRLLRAQRKVEAHLRRPLALDLRTERVRLRHHRGYGLFGGGWAAYPAATPVVSAVGLTVEGSALLGASGAWLSWWDDGEQYADVSYVGGWTALTLPEPILEAICRLAALGGRPSPVPAGATSVRNGDVAITYAPGASGAQLDPALTRALKPYVRRRL